MSYTEKIDVLDLLINVLREHEEKLDELVERRDQIVSSLNLGSFSQTPGRL